MFIRILLISLMAATSTAAYAEFDVDDADSLDFSSFHSSKKVAKPPAKNKPKTAAAIALQAEGLVVSAHYNPEHSEQTLHAIAALHKQLAQGCPQGWLKEKEWSQYIAASDYQLHYQFSCLTN